MKTERCGANNKVLLIQLNRPKALNALCGQLMDELERVVGEAEVDSDIHCMVLTGSEKAFAGKLINALCH